MYTIGKNNKEISNPIENYMDGATLDLYTLQPIDKKTGFGVSITNTVLHDEKDINNIIENYQHFAKYINDTVYLGVWCEGGEYCIDLTIIVPNEKQARVIGDQFKQDGIWDFKNENTIWL
jgi:hypothetical protein